MKRLHVSWPALATLVAAVVVVAPLCGALFGCGCTWPWAGFIGNCASLGGPGGRLCPWCELPVTGLVSVVAAIFAGTATAKQFSHPTMSFGREPFAARSRDFLVTTVLGILVFVTVAMITAIPHL
ncbi:MAG: hypothetical protein ABFS02_09465 [Pseudomonadota bacterium]